MTKITDSQNQDHQAQPEHEDQHLLHEEKQQHSKAHGVLDTRQNGRWDSGTASPMAKAKEKAKARLRLHVRGRGSASGFVSLPQGSHLFAVITAVLVSGALRA